MQNKANFRKSQMNVNLYNTTAYENKSNWTPGENKPNSKPIKANLHFTAENTEHAEKKDISVSDCSIERYALYHISPCSLRTRRLMKNKAKTKPIKANFKRGRLLIDPEIRLGATIFNPIKKLTTNRTGANLKGQRIIWRSGCFWTWGIVHRMAKPRTYFLGDRRMESHTNLFIFVILAGLVFAGFAQEAVAGAGEPNEASAPSFPFVAEITGDNLYVRSGPGTNYYHCGKLNKGDKVKVVDRQFSWSCIVPPAGSFSWISMQYVKIDPNNPAAGTVTGDSVRVYAGSDYVKPLYSTTLQGKLNRGEKVKLLGEQMDDYYKIAPPPFAYLWVSTDFTKPLGSVSEVPLTGPDGTLMVGPEMVSAEVRLKEYQALEEQMKAEQSKPMDQQNYTKIKRSLVTIADDKAAGKAARYAEFMIKQIDGFELALAVGKEVQLQNKQLQKIKEGIDKARARRLAEVEDMGRFVAVGRLRTFMTYGPGHYRIVDESGKTACYALPANLASTRNLGRLIDRKVGLVGKVEPHRQTSGALVRFTEIVGID